MLGFFQKLLLYSVLVVILMFSPMSTAFAQSEPAELGVFESFQVAPGSAVQVPISIRNVEDLYGLEFTIEFDPAFTQVVDADPVSPGVQAALGDFLDPGLLLFNTADNEAGTIHFAMAQYNPSEPKSGDGIILILTFKGKSIGETELKVNEVILSTRDGVEIPSTGVDSTLSVVAGAPTQAVTYPAAQTTGLILISTFTPTPIPTKTPVPTLTPQVTQEFLVESSSSTDTDSNPDDKTNASRYFLVKNWWIVLLLALVVLSVGLFTFRRKKDY